MLQILINDTDMTAFLASRSLKIDTDSTYWKSCSLTLTNIKMSDGVPAEGKQLTVKWLGTPDKILFNGVINNKTIKQLSPSTEQLTVSLTANSLRNVPYRRTVSINFDVVPPQDYVSAGYIVKYLIDNHLIDEGITYLETPVNSILEGKLYEDGIEFVCMSIGDILDQLASDSNANWYINPQNVLYFVGDYYSFDGDDSFDIDVDTTITLDVRNLELKTDLTNYANKIFFKGALEDGDDIQATAQDDDEIFYMASLDGGSGVYGAVVSNQSITTLADAQAYVNKQLKYRRVKPKAITFDTLNWNDLQVGQRQNIHIPLIGVTNNELKNKNYVVESTSISDLGNGILSSKIEMRQLYSDVDNIGNDIVVWLRKNQGMNFFKGIANTAKTVVETTKKTVWQIGIEASQTGVIVRNEKDNGIRNIAISSETPISPKKNDLWIKTNE